jgi:hypothetical protein
MGCRPAQGGSREMSRWLQLSNYHALVVFLLMGVFATLFAWNSYNLVHLAMQNFRFLREAGLLAVMEGGLRQLAGIILYGLLSLAFYVGFKACEVELVYRWRGSRTEK